MEKKTESVSSYVIGLEVSFMTYNLTREELLDFAKIVYEQSIHGYLDLKDGACERMLVNFLSDKKTLLPHTNVTMSAIGSAIASQTFNADIFTISESFTGGQNLN